MMQLTDTGVADAIGTVVASDSDNGLLLTPYLHGLTPGEHGFHVHENPSPSCAPNMKDGKPVPGLGAAGHHDPGRTDRHEGPTGQGHLGDLPALSVDATGRAGPPVLAPRLRVADLRGRSLIIHAGGDNYSDQPKPLGGGGARIACGIID